MANIHTHTPPNDCRLGIHAQIPQWMAGGSNRWRIVDPGWMSVEPQSMDWAIN